MHKQKLRVYSCAFVFCSSCRIAHRAGAAFLSFLCVLNRATSVPWRPSSPQRKQITCGSMRPLAISHQKCSAALPGGARGEAYRHQTQRAYGGC